MPNRNEFDPGGVIRRGLSQDSNPFEVWQAWNYINEQFRKRKGVNQQQCAKEIGIEETIYCEMMGGDKRLSKGRKGKEGNVEKLIRGYIRKGYIKTSVEAYTLLELARKLPGYRPNEKETEILREVISKAFLEYRNIRIAEVLADDAVSLQIEITASSDQEYGRLYTILENRGDMQDLLNIMQKWRKDNLK